MRLLYPNAMLTPKEADGIFEAEHFAAKEAGLKASLFSLEGLQMGKRIPVFDDGDSVLYRGWMMTPFEYQELCDHISQSGGVPLVSPAAYQFCHYLPNWYSSLSDLTPETVVFQEGADVAADLRSRGWDGCFLKDYVKSLSGSSLVTNLDHIPDVVARMKKYRGRIEGGLCARRIEEYDQRSERRHFVYRGIAHSADDDVPELVLEVARRVDSPFFSVDTILRRDDVLRVVEIGDGQVSDLKEWSPQAFVALFA